jgi:hypothetical protein
MRPDLHSARRAGAAAGAAALSPVAAWIAHAEKKGFDPANPQVAKAYAMFALAYHREVKRRADAEISALEDSISRLCEEAMKLPSSGRLQLSPRRV